MGFFDTIISLFREAGFPPMMIALIAGIIGWFFLIHKQIEKIQDEASNFIHKEKLANFVHKDLCTMYKKNTALETTLVESLNAKRLDAIEAQMQVITTKIDKMHAYLVQVSKARKENKDGH